jgi:hypothetical protein
VLTVITSFGTTGYELYGRGFIETFRQFWPASVKLICAWEGPGPHAVDGFDLLETEPCASFIRRHKSNPVVHGKRNQLPAEWGKKARLKGYSFRHDAYKFGRKVFAVAQAARFCEGGKLFWIDADVRTHRPMPEAVLNMLLPDDVSLCYLSRDHWNYHSELGFVGYNLDRLETHAFIAAYEARYANDEFLDSPTGWDDCNQFDRLVEKTKPAVRHIAHGSNSQPFDDSILGRYMTHQKGSKKLGGPDSRRKIAI